MFGCDCCCLSSFVYLVGLFAIATKVLPCLKKALTGKKPVELQEKNFKKDVVYLFQFGGTRTASSLSPFCIKIEAFLRLHEIKFERRNTMSSRGQNNLLPFIELNGEVHSDSQIILRRLTQIFKLKAYPNEEKAAVGHAIDRLVDNHTFNVMLYCKKNVVGVIFGPVLARYVPAILVPVVTPLAGWFGGRMMGKRAAASIGKFAENEVNELLKNDLTQLQTILGNKKFMLDEEPTLVDCTIFGQFASMIYAVPAARTYVNELVESAEFAPLKAYLERTKERIFGDEFTDKE